ncbi:hypothetical protein TrVE_jg10123 [Triparma verrucosa]|uniref:gamma-glutamylcyclotransferase n=1 Tax=Triparma verrucosa TaxID=1606542 RepID=A0A9W7C1T2_9STRA|nr:hypothetical protein TrVE_jg10123 [Triparma verrucosa]
MNSSSDQASSDQDTTDTTVWSFGFGSNMNVDIVKNKKGVAVIEHIAGCVKNWTLSFTAGGLDLVEPSMGNATPMDGGELHGVALRLTPEDMTKMDKQEGYNPTGDRGYAKVEVTVSAYNGRTFKAWVYSSRKPKPSQPCSSRYLNILVSGARDAGLDPTYIDRLAERPTYKPSPSVLSLRSEIPELGSLPPMTVEELAKTKEDVDEDDPDSNVHVSIHGLIFRLPKSKVFFKSHRGRDITARFSRHFRGISMDANDDFGKPPFRLPRDFDSEEEREYLRMWQDHYLSKGGVGSIVAHLVEYRAQLETASTSSTPSPPNPAPAKNA